MTATWVYRCYGADDRLLYVGCSRNLLDRFRAHRNTSWWSPQVVKVKAKVYADSMTAHREERHLIAGLAPRWNVQGKIPRTPSEALDLATALERSINGHLPKAQKRAARMRAWAEAAELANEVAS